jgi:hypothetical protein
LTLEDVPLAKPVLLDLAVAEGTTSPGARLALYFAGGDSTWRRLGGTFDAANRRLAAPVSAAGRFATYAVSQEPATPGELPGLSLTPRVFSPRGGFANTSVGIGFVLARAGPVRVTVHNRAGRLVREVLSGATLGAGANLVRWDGRDEEGRVVGEGLYVVTVEAPGGRQVRTLAVVR